MWLGVAAVLIGLAFLVWSRYADHCYQQAELPFVDLRLSGPEMKFWFFGDLHYRFSPGVWMKGLWRSSTALFGSFALLGLFIIGLTQRPRDRLALCWLLGGVISTLIFFQIVLRHYHYYLMFGPPVAILCGRAADRIYPLLFASGWNRRLGPLTVLAALAVSTAQGLYVMHAIILFDRYPGAMAAIIRANTNPADKLVIQGGGWGGELLFLSGRQGLSVWDTKPLENAEIYARLKARGFTKLVMVSESPLLSAVQHVTSTSPGIDRRSYQSATTPVIEPWRTILKSEDILIKELP